MAETATIYHFTIDLADLDRGVFDTLELRVARHPSETLEYMAVRVLAFCLEYEAGITFTDGGVSSGEPALLVKDPTGAVTAWIDVGLPDAARLHRASKLASRVAVYPHRDIRQWLGLLDGEKIHRRENIRLRALDLSALEAFIARFERRTSMSLTISHGEAHVAIGADTLTVPFGDSHL